MFETAVLPFLRPCISQGVQFQIYFKQAVNPGIIIYHYEWSANSKSIKIAGIWQEQNRIMNVLIYFL